MLLTYGMDCNTTELAAIKWTGRRNIKSLKRNIFNAINSKRIAYTEI
jgi:hypothetical protein